MISSAIITAVSGYLAEAGFTVKPEYTDDVEARPAVQSGAVYPAFICVKKTELCEFGITGTDSRRCTAEVTLRVRALGSTPGFGRRAHHGYHPRVPADTRPAGGTPGFRPTHAAWFANS